MAPPPPVSVPRAPFAALIVVLVVGGVLGILAVNTKINENAFRLEKLQQQQARLDLEKQQLDKQIADAEAPGNLTAEARRLGLVEAGEPAYIRLPDGKAHRRAAAGDRRAVDHQRRAREADRATEVGRAAPGSHGRPARFFA